MCPNVHLVEFKWVLLFSWATVTCCFRIHTLDENRFYMLFLGVIGETQLGFVFFWLEELWFLLQLQSAVVGLVCLSHDECNFEK